ncbi:MAG: hypothetical protein JWL77_6845 [Chthonomonadaceae bacterium]|nr:hypothetical protein [Chthonomonadaceae bacterium]
MTTSDVSATPTAERSGVRVYGALVDAELRAQDARKASFEQRGLAVVTTSGVLVTLLFALAGLSTKTGTTFVLREPAQTWLVGALVAFVLAAAVALATNIPLPYEAVTSADVEKRLREQPIRSEDRAERDVALTRLKGLADAKCKNGIKGWLLFAAIGLEVTAVALLGVAVSIVIGA